MIYGDEFAAKIMDVRLALTSLYNEYAIESTRNAFNGRLSNNVGSTSSGASNSSGTTGSSSVASLVVSIGKWELSLKGFLKENSSIQRNSDLETYLDEALWPTTEDEFDILGWWKNNAAKYCEVARMALDILAIPVSTVASESLFSTGGRTIDDYMSNLVLATIETLMCCQDWLRSSTKGNFFSFTFI